MAVSCLHESPGYVFVSWLHRRWDSMILWYGIVPLDWEVNDRLDTRYSMVLPRTRTNRRGVNELHQGFQIRCIIHFFVTTSWRPRNVFRSVFLKHRSGCCRHDSTLSDRQNKAQFLFVMGVCVCVDGIESRHPITKCLNPFRWKLKRIRDIEMHALEIPTVTWFD